MIKFPEIDWNLLLPQATLVTTAFLLLLMAVFSRTGPWRQRTADSRRRMSVGSAAGWGALLSLLGLAVCAYMTAHQWGNVAASFGSLLRLDPFATFMNLLIIAGAILCVLLSVAEAGGLGSVAGEYYALIIFATLGMVAMVAAADLIVVFVALETMSLAIYILVCCKRGDSQGSEAALKYFLMGAFASGFLIYGISLLYGATGTTNFSRIAADLEGGSAGGLTLVALGLVLTGFLFKIAAVPFHMWVPDAYEGAPTPITAFMAVAVKAAAFGVLMRLLTVGLMPLSEYWLPAMWTLSIATMTVGNLAAVFQGNIKRMLAYSSVAHAGYLLVALASLGPGASSGGPGDELALISILFYLVVYTLMNAGAFGVLIYLGTTGRRMETLEQVRGAGFRHPLTGAAMAVFMFSLAGIPPTGGFLGKFYIFSAAIHQGLIALAVIGVLNSAVSVYYYLRVIVQMYMRESDESLPAVPFSLTLTLALAVSVLGVLLLGVAPAGLLDVAGRAVLFLK
ncbi:MAG: NADH-quinone oxidoreductase subunit N [Gemmatimonadota bacterium]|nr:NADH-quinone oxidoreductase subunit N [Gemmatimonadota bacterium]